MKIKLKIYDAKYPVPNYFAFDFVSVYVFRHLVVNDIIWLCQDINNHSCALDVTENIRTILKHSPARTYPNVTSNSKN